MRFTAVEPAVDGLTVEARDGTAPTVAVTQRDGRAVRSPGRRRDRVPADRARRRGRQPRLAGLVGVRAPRRRGGPPVDGEGRRHPALGPSRGRGGVGLVRAPPGRTGGGGGERLVDPRAAGRARGPAHRARGSPSDVRLFRSRVDGVAAGARGMEVTVLPGAVPGLFVRNDTAGSWRSGPGGRPFLRTPVPRALLADPTGAYQPSGAPEVGLGGAPGGMERGEIPERLCRPRRPPSGSASGRSPIGSASELAVEGTLEWVPVRAHHGAARPAGDGARSVARRRGLVVIAGRAGPPGSRPPPSTPADRPGTPGLWRTCR